ncbi:Acyl-coenzyme A oxidase 1, peroxisomal [Serinicoccus hydrothermalis]|uniref:acyl-CoA oxidase n=1 Tax=Serinicoccus hydrothermalis TaxID=1758689 RepID=A0A1B1NFS4_9MICO|nr:acyl-CoA dehydrogenase [Serinicoccus hydrothermalis]ANS80245.1 Acyl-coenzyme A oxidase 1, peroxisomal [Serinicoccus hydrothermalis]
MTTSTRQTTTPHPGTDVAMPDAAAPQASEPRSTEQLTDLGQGLRAATGGRYGPVRDLARASVPAEVMVRDASLDMAGARAWTNEALRSLVRYGMAGSGFPTTVGGLDDVGRSCVDFEMTAHGDLSLTVKSGVHFGLYGGAVTALGNEWHHETFLRPNLALEQIGCYAMTEFGHGSDVASLQTTHTYDPETDEIVVHSPTPSSTKTYIGAAAQDAHVAAVYGQLHVGEESHGVHVVVVPIRDADGNPLPGVTLGDNGAKGGLAGVDNGTITFDHVRVPRAHLLNRFGGIDDEGRYVSDIDSDNKRFFTMLGTLVRGRICVAAGAATASRKALSIATRYALRRRQFSAPGHDGDVVLMDYLAHQRKLIPAIATAYAHTFAVNEVVERLQELHEMPEKDQVAQRELETRAAGLKAVITRFGNDTIQTCREACGGAGYLAENGLTVLRGDADVFATFEGDNTVLLQLVAKGLLSGYKEMWGDLDMRGMVQFAARTFGGQFVEATAARPLIERLRTAAARKGEGETLLDRGWQLAMFADRERHVLETLATRLRRRADDQDSFEAFNSAQDHVLLAARTHMDRVVLEAFVAGIEECEDEQVREVLDRLCTLHALTSIDADSGWFQAHNRMSAGRAKAVVAQINELCAELRPQVLDLVEGLGIPETWLNSQMLQDDTSARWTPGADV